MAQRLHTSDIVYRPRDRAVALIYGLVCHISFAAGIAAMIGSIYTGMTLGLGPFTGGAALLANAALLAQFAVLHSLLLSARGRRIVSRLAPFGLGGPLATTIYATLASLQLLACFVFWSPSGIAWWKASGGLLVVSTLLYAGAWLLLLKTMADAGLGVQTGFAGWSAVVRGRRPQWPALATKGTFRFTRQPVYVAFALTLWTAPQWTPDRLALALGWTAYCLVGPLFKERRYRSFYGETFERYRASVPYWLPRRR
jgi:protein-S-isoprenylcysteine O-methyltransferase Ste14